MEDPLISLLKKRIDVLKIYGRIWDALHKVEYEEKASPDIGKRREFLFRLLLENELGLVVEGAPSTERDWDIKVVFPEGNERYYNIKTYEEVTVITVVWDSPSSKKARTKARTYEFKHPILYITRRRARDSIISDSMISVYVFEPKDIEEVKSRLGETRFWSRDNQIGFGISKDAVEKLIDIAMGKGNYVTTRYSPLRLTDDMVRESRRKIYGLYKELVKE